MTKERFWTGQNDKIYEFRRTSCKIEARNKRVEADKAWETSWTRKSLIAIFTYLAIALYMKFVLGVNPWINAIVPTVGFLLSTLTFSYFKELWVRYFYKK